jgi:hypothetical protein
LTGYEGNVHTSAASEGRAACSSYGLSALNFLSVRISLQSDLTVQPDVVT